jgi:sortase (surface protein transpeptidase)
VDFNKAGWYSGGVVPGQIGPAIIAGHIDSVTAPAVFANLHRVTPGMKILVSISDGSVLTFEAERSEVAPKTQFPSSSVYGNVPTPQLRVITCDGTFNRATGHYNDNLVVYATLVTT